MLLSALNNSSSGTVIIFLDLFLHPRVRSLNILVVLSFRAFKLEALQFLVAKNLAVSHLPLEELPAVQA